MRTKIVAGNWKMNKTATEAAALVADIRQAVQDGKGTVEVVVCPPFTDLKTAAEALQGSNIGLGAQNMHWKESGAYTGEVSAAMLKDLGVKYVILGHSERRQYFAETDQTVNLKLHAALAAGLIPIVCVGETLEEREAGKMQEVIVRQVKEGLKDADLSTVVIAYEPVWAIGTGRAASAEDAEKVCRLIKDSVRVSVLYGGSVKPSNAAELFSRPSIDGGLIGGASLKARDFFAILKNFRAAELEAVL